MPELPETETIARDLDRQVSGATIVAVGVPRPDVLRETGAMALRRRITGARIEHCWRRAKLVVLDLSTGDRLVVQPRFTGALLVDAGQLDQRERAYATVRLGLGDGRTLLYRDIRRLGTVALMPTARFERYAAGLGAEPLDPEFGPGELSGLLRGSRQAVKKLLMDQRKLAGVGNIYANEALWRAGIDPSRAARSLDAAQAAALHAGLTGVLREAVAARGTSFRDYRDASGNAGAFAEQLAVYGRAGHPCPRCGARLVGTHAIDGRSTVLCARCQH
ncbi:MAG: bifunctional DNA-formamidopyrimidine glycosylase/DNA-(apurinic or apyrimidinic site) lyase [Gemmatimonadota bacterium]|nr:bifunctional DNA-formamidopyrimidine glycosylase/DNA-(apurinic or apyrimidinic site) lyase [Gemmatimonadota bacterium]MDE3171902.1 bifunctional DNA-formamidopyrimidine glycosylase/DNA-(apurinic or apyrimidinic site) lyase [Gemmatimonadota bacterium]MDE3216870.1 bifunctional DNA-formamidopyrimidine glycosylase/DNA-(apurinic or apyrimidinic site) lyase [Gemmatimonadota bacterium]